VGAFPKRQKVGPNNKWITASYSNLADRPKFTGVTTFGGEPGEGSGALGLYLGKFPCGEANCTKWAWWAGTSFATPIFTGIVAAVLSGDGTGPLPAAQAAIDILNNRDIIKQSISVDDEDGLDVTQG
jgi:subtilisin family serine protease